MGNAELLAEPGFSRLREPPRSIVLTRQVFVPASYGARASRRHARLTLGKIMAAASRSVLSAGADIMQWFDPTKAGGAITLSRRSRRAGGRRPALPASPGATTSG
jgi:hypothetical protein